MIVSCSTTSSVPDGDYLFTGVRKISYEGDDRSEHSAEIKEEVSAALASSPNGALFGSSRWRTPFQVRLWTWNAFHNYKKGLGKWLASSIGKPPVLMSRVNPSLRSSVAEGVLHAGGYMRGKVDYNVLIASSGKKASVEYDVHMGELFKIDSIRYVGFTNDEDSLLEANAEASLIKAGTPFSASVLTAERARISELLRNNGYYYYQPGYISYEADTVNTPGSVNLRLRSAVDIPEEAKRKWYIGNVEMSLRKQVREELTDSLLRRRFLLRFRGKRSPVRPRVLLRGVRMRKEQLYKYDNYVETASRLNATGLFSSIDIRLTPRPEQITLSLEDDTISRERPDTLDVDISCVLDKPYDFYIETNMRGKTTGAIGPELVLGVTKRNAFKGGEKLSVDLKGSYEWQTGHDNEGTKSHVHSYEYGVSSSLDYPRLLMPNKWSSWLIGRKGRRAAQPSTIIKASTSVLNRPDYFKRHVVSGEFTWHFNTSSQMEHSLSPLILSYEYMTKQTETFRSILSQSPYLTVAMADQFVPKLRYAFTWTSAKELLNPIRVQVSFSEASNILSLGYLIAGRKWNERSKEMFKNPFAQFLKTEVDFVKKWQLSTNSSLVAHANAGVVWAFGNSETAPYSELFYVGGANSIRAFNARAVGPGRYKAETRINSYIDQTGDVRFMGNIEWRPKLFGHLQGALFIDAGNVWTLHRDETRSQTTISKTDLFRDIALGTGVGFRYDLDFFVIRLDWGYALHVPSRSGFINPGKFKDAQCLHLAVGYPF